MQGVIILNTLTPEALIESVKDAVNNGIEEAGIDMLLTTAEVARVLDVSEATIRNYCRAGKLKNYSPGTHDKWSLREVIKIRRAKL